MVTHKLHMDLCGHEVLQWVDVMQGDVGSRNLEIALFQGVLPWQIPEDVTVLIRYRKEDKTWGEYDTQPDGTSAWAARENVLALALAPQITTLPGTVRLSVCLLRDGEILNTFPLEIRVRENLELADGIFRRAPEDYTYLTGWLPAPDDAKAGQHIRIAEVDENGKVTAVEAVYLSQDAGSAELVDEEMVYQIVEEYLTENPPGEGTSMTHSWDGTVLTVTSASGTSSADLKGDAGQSGVYILAEGESPEDAPAEADVVIDPSGEEETGTGGAAEYIGIEPAEEDIPKIFFGGALQQEKVEAVVPFSYRSKTLSFDCYAEIKAQGNSTLRWPKKNQTVKLYQDEACTEKLKVNFKGWGKQSKFVIKANWRDLTHVRDIVSVRLEGDCTRARSDFEELPELLRTSPNLGGVDGFPVLVYAAGIYQGRYMWNIPKDKWMANMDDELDEHCILCSENYVSGCFRAAANIDESDWTDEIHDTVPDSIKTRWNEVISFVMNSTDEEFVANLDSYIDVNSLSIRHLMGLLSCDFDGYGKNQLYVTYDGQKWYASRYDKDGTWGNFWNGTTMLPSDYGREQYEDMTTGVNGNLLFIRLEQLFWEKLQADWAVLRVGTLSIPNIINRFRELYDITPPHLIAEDYASTTAGGAFTAIPNKTTCTIQQIQTFVVERHAWMDEYVAGLTPEIPVPCEGITLDSETLTFSGEGTQTITATVAPDGCTDGMVWVSSNPSVATISVDGAVCTVTAVANGSTTITVTCGEYSASCAVAVSGIAEPVACTGITLDKTELALDGEGTQTITATVTPSDTTDAIVWSSSDETIATVENGVVTAVYNGNAIITAICGGQTATCEVAVSGFPEKPLYSFENGTYSTSDVNYGGTLTVTNGNHVNIVRTASYPPNLSLYKLPTSGGLNYALDNARNQPTIFSLKTGDILRIVVTYSDINAHVGSASLAFVHAGAITTTEYAKNFTGSIDNTITITADVDVGGITCWWSNEATMIDCDFEIYVNDVRYV